MFKKISILIQIVSSLGVTPSTCPAGQVQSLGACSPCSRGSYRSASDAQCLKCPAGTYTEKLGAIECSGPTTPSRGELALANTEVKSLLKAIKGVNITQSADAKVIFDSVDCPADSPCVFKAPGLSCVIDKEVLESAVKNLTDTVQELRRVTSDHRQSSPVVQKLVAWNSAVADVDMYLDCLLAQYSRGGPAQVRDNLKNSLYIYITKSDYLMTARIALIQDKGDRDELEKLRLVKRLRGEMLMVNKIVWSNSADVMTSVRKKFPGAAILALAASALSAVGLSRLMQPKFVRRTVTVVDLTVPEVTDINNPIAVDDVVVRVPVIRDVTRQVAPDFGAVFGGKVFKNGQKAEWREELGVATLFWQNGPHAGKPVGETAFELSKQLPELGLKGVSIEGLQAAKQQYLANQEALKLGVAADALPKYTMGCYTEQKGTITEFVDKIEKQTDIVYATRPVESQTEIQVEQPLTNKDVAMRGTAIAVALAALAYAGYKAWNYYTDYKAAKVNDAALAGFTAQSRAALEASMPKRIAMNATASVVKALDDVTIRGADPTRVLAEIDAQPDILATKKDTANDEFRRSYAILVTICTNSTQGGIPATLAGKYQATRNAALAVMSSLRLTSQVVNYYTPLGHAVIAKAALPQLPELREAVSPLAEQLKRVALGLSVKVSDAIRVIQGNPESSRAGYSINPLTAIGAVGAAGLMYANRAKIATGIGSLFNTTSTPVEAKKPSSNNKTLYITIAIVGPIVLGILGYGCFLVYRRMSSN